MKIFLVIIFVCLLALLAKAQPFINEIKAFKTEDSLHFPPKGAILFVGSSSLRKWTDIQTYFPSHKIINRGFGGSTLSDVIRYAEDIIFPYQPKQIIIYCGDNDFASSDTVTAEVVFSRVKQLFNLIRSKMHNENIAYISIKPSPSRASLMPKMSQANAMIKSFLSTQKNTSFIDVYHLMLAENGKPKPEIFLSDSLHMNEHGYAIWQKAIEPYLVK